MSKRSGQSFKIRGGKFNGDVKARFFCYTMVGACNTLPGLVVKADMIVMSEAFRQACRYAGNGLKWMCAGRED